MKILYAIQGTGNGHISRAKTILPHLKEYGEVDILVSGNQCDISLDHPIKYRFHGAGFIFGKNGGVDIWKSLKNSETLRLLKDIFSLPVETYDLVFSDFEPISSWACKLKDKRCIGISHQASFLSKNSPRPKKKQHIAEWLMKNYAPTDDFVGFHFESYDNHISTPIIQPCIRNAVVRNDRHILVYLPSFDPNYLAQFFSRFSVYNWKIYIKETPSTSTAYRNIEIIKCGSTSWQDDLISCEGAVVGGGFETPSELLYLGKKMIVIPMKNQYEQACNAAALEGMGISVLHSLQTKDRKSIHQWLAVRPVERVHFPDNTASVLSKVISRNMELDMELSYAFNYGM